jgi:hypothetical protein
VNEWPFATLRFVQQSDRRQRSDRRKEFRGGRRALDFGQPEQAVSANDATMLWNVPQEYQRAAVDKSFLN